MSAVEGFQKFADIPFGLARIFEILMPQKTGANRRKNRSIPVKVLIRIFSPFVCPALEDMREDIEADAKVPNRLEKINGTVRENDQMFGC
jgi:hypothetical protein